MKILYIFLTATNNKPIQLEYNFNLDDKDIDIMVCNTQDFFDSQTHYYSYDNFIKEFSEGYIIYPMA